VIEPPLTGGSPPRPSSVVDGLFPSFGQGHFLETRLTGFAIRYLFGRGHGNDLIIESTGFLCRGRSHLGLVAVGILGLTPEPFGHDLGCTEHGHVRSRM